MGWVDPSACSALCALILDDRKGGGGISAQWGKPAAGRRRALPPSLYAEHVAPFLRFDEPQPNMLYAIGGRNQRHGSLSTVEMFDTWHGQWVPCPPMPTRRAGSAAALLPRGRVLVVGGYNERGIVDGLLATCDVYDPYAQRWTEGGAAPLSRARWGHGCAALHGRVYAVGGCSLRQGSMEPREAFMETLRSCEVYTPEEDRWRPCAPLQIARSGSRVVALENQLLVAVGGCDDVFGRATTQPTVELYDPAAECWTVLSSRLRHPRTTAGVAAIGDSRLVVIGGAPSLSSAEIYCVALPKGTGSARGGRGQPREEQRPEEAGACSAASEAPSHVADMAEGRMGCQAATVQLPEAASEYPLSRWPCVVLVGGERCSEGGGEDWAHVQQFAGVPVYDVAKKAWRPEECAVMPPLPSPRTAVALCVGVGRVAVPK